MTADGQLLERLKFRDRTALELIYDEYYLLLWKACCKEFESQADCERILMEVFQQLWEHPHQFSGNKRLVYYLIECTNQKIVAKINERQCPFLDEKTCS